jgi:CDP-paratose 2-epimerase
LQGTDFALHTLQHRRRERSQAPSNRSRPATDSAWARPSPQRITTGTADEQTGPMTSGTVTPDLRVDVGGSDDSRPVAITGGAGFIGTNLADRLLSRGVPVVVVDNLSRPGVELNLQWLKDTHGSLVRTEVVDVRDASRLTGAIAGARRVVHLAAQVAVTTSLADPVHDFDVNALGTLNVLNAIRSLAEPVPLLYTSTNKVYGSLQDVALRQSGRRYEPVDETLRLRGVDEMRPLDFQSPYGCSKGAADQYVLDYARSYGLQTCVFRMSCVYGPHQFGTEDQGWVAHFLIQTLAGRPITLYGDGLQLRDVLFVDDLVDAIEAAFDNMDAVSGRAFNIGGGPANTTSLVELLDRIHELCGSAPLVSNGPWRAGDQKYYVSDTSSFTALTGWQPRRDVVAGLTALHHWLARGGARVETSAVLAAEPVVRQRAAAGLR